ncbi:DNA alkylation repair protein [Pararhodobacter zhoushanensis]|uniref:DNA alkylation repair protein n=1 Tax=Pararhodobacter zhoushanensis TaxID=2479545 RepID=UPI000F8C6436|nr:DNA alkylation repair protein [Pararhodobacter zhoushanensis]
MNEQDVSPDAALATLNALADPVRAEEMRAYHKIDRPYLGLSNPQIDELVKGWRVAATLDERVALAAGLWDSGIHEAMLAAAKLLAQARIRPDDTAVWELIASWAEGFEGWAVSDFASSAGGRRLVVDPSRLDGVEGWTASPNMWTRRAALVMTLPWARMPNPKPEDLAVRERVLGWAAGYVTDRDWFIQKAVGWWLRDLSKHDPERTRSWMAEHGAGLKSFARKEALRHLPG